MYLLVFFGAGDILHASDDLSRVINSYKKIVEGQTIMIDIPGSTASEGMYDNVPEFLHFMT